MLRSPALVLAKIDSPGRCYFKLRLSPGYTGAESAPNAPIRVIREYSALPLRMSENSGGIREHSGRDSDGFEMFKTIRIPSRMLPNVAPTNLIRGDSVVIRL